MGLDTHFREATPLQSGNPATILIQTTVPTGHIPVKLDDRGRLKLPSLLKKLWVDKLDIAKVFVTSLDGRTIQIFTPAGWQGQLEALQSFSEDRKAAQKVLFAAKCFGSDAEVDEAGRMLMPDALRKQMSLADQTVWLDPIHAGRINVYPDAVYQEMKALKLAGLDGAYAMLEEKGVV